MTYLGVHHNPFPILTTYLGTESHCTAMSCSERFGDDELAALEFLLNKWFGLGLF